MKYNQLMEGVIKVPPSLMSTLNRYLASTICTMLYKNIELVQKVGTKMPEKAEEQLKRIKQVIQYLKQNYNAVILNDSTYNSILQSSINVPVDFPKFFSELNMPVTDENKNNIYRSKLSLTVRPYIADGSGGSLSSDKDLTTFMIEIKCDLNLAPLDENIFARAKDIMGSMYHEAQHYVQRNVLARINPNQKQLQSTSAVDQSSTKEQYDDYLSSGIEYSPWMGDLMNSIITELEIMKAHGDLPNEGLNKIFMGIITKLTSDDKKSYGKFLYKVYKKDPQQYKDTMKKLFKMVQPAYESIKNASELEVLGDLTQEEIPVDFDVMGTLFSELKPAVENDGGSFKAYGRSIDSITEIKIQYPNYIVSITPSKDTYTVTMTGDTISTYSRSLSSADTLQLANALKRYGDDEELTYSLIEQTRADGKFSTDAVEKVFSRISELNENQNSEKVQYTSSEIVLGGVTYEVKPTENSYQVTSPELMLLDANLKNSVALSMFLQDIVYAISRTSPQEVQEVLENCFSAYDAMKDLRSM